MRTIVVLPTPEERRYTSEENALMPVSAVSPHTRPFSHIWLAFLSFALLLSAATVSHAAPNEASVVIGGRPIPFTVTPYIGSDGHVYAPVDAVHLMGANFVVNGLLVTVTGANGQQTTVPFIAQRGHACVDLQRVALALGASTTWQPESNTLTIRAKLEMVRQDPDALLIYTSYPVSYQVQHIDNPSRLYVDVYGLDLAAAPAAIPVAQEDGQGTNVLRIRSGQINENTVRITIDLKHSLPFTVASKTQTDRIQVALGTAGRTPPMAIAENPPATRPSPPRTIPPMPVPPVRPAPVVVNNPSSAAPVTPTEPSVRITNVSVKTLSDDVTQIAVTATGQAKYRTEALDAPNRLAFDLAGATLDAAVTPALPGTGPIIKAVRAGIMHTGVAQFGRVVIDLSRLVAYNISHEVAGDGSVTYLINLETPHQDGTSPIRPPNLNPISPANSLAGKIIVVDPGHGLQDSGALGPDGSMEKNFTLAIGRKLRDALQQSGATVYMTREDDAFLPVMARPQFAAAHQADYFISIHCDSSGAQNSHTGTTVYFHAQNAVCHRMAQDILNRVAELSGIPADATKSDTIRFQTGFGVLRGSPMPAVLVECGYMNNDQDLAKLKDEDTQEHIAEGIVAGLRDFIADRSAR
jgi:N-acetylmuramoyl-L-alanine amidase